MQFDRGAKSGRRVPSLSSRNRKSFTPTYALALPLMIFGYFVRSFIWTCDVMFYDPAGLTT